MLDVRGVRRSAALIRVGLASGTRAKILVWLHGLKAITALEKSDLDVSRGLKQWLVMTGLLQLKSSLSSERDRSLSLAMIHLGMTYLCRWSFTSHNGTTERDTHQAT